MTKRQIALRVTAIFLAGALCGAAVGAFLLWPRADAFDASLYWHIKEGMTREEVIALLGVPPGDYHTDTRLCVRCYATSSFVVTAEGKLLQECTYEIWVSNRGVIEVGFDKECKVIGKSFTPLDREPPSDLPLWVRVVEALNW
jgi:hypothetical protein